MSNNIVQLNDDTFDSFVAKTKLPILVDFYADWCGPCRIMAPVLDEIAEEMHGKLLVAKINVDEANLVANRYRVQGIPFFLILKDGNVMESKTGATSKSSMIDLINKVI